MSPKPDGPLPHISSDLAGHPCPSSYTLCVPLANGELANDSIVLLMLGYSSRESHSRGDRTHSLSHGKGWRLVLLASLRSV